MYKPNNVLIHLQNKSRDGSDKTILKRDNTNECGNVILVIRPNGDTVIVTETNELVLDNAVMEQIVRNSGAYKSFIATKDDVVAGLECDNSKLQIKVRELKEELETIKADRDKLQENLVNATVGAEPMVKGHVVNQERA